MVITDASKHCNRGLEPTKESDENLSLHANKAAVLQTACYLKS